MWVYIHTYYFISYMITKKKIALFSFIWVLSISGIAFGWYKVYQSTLEQGYKDDYTFEEINTLLLTKQEDVIEKLETSLSQKNQEVSSELSRTGSLSFEAKGTTPFGSGSMNISLGNYMSAFQDTSLALWLKDVSFWAEGVIMDQKQSASGSVESFDIKVFQSGSYLQMKDIILSPHDIFRNLPFEYINVLNTLAASGSYLHIPYDESTFDEFNLQIEEYKDIVSQQRQKQSKSLSGALNYIKTRPLFEVSKQVETRYYIVPTKAFCAFIKAGEKKDEMGESSFWELWNMLGKSIPMEAADIDFSQLTDCDDAIYSSFLKNFSQIFSLYIEKNTTKGHISLELLQNEKFTGVINIYFGLSGVEKSVITLSPNQSGSISWSGIHLELEQKMLSGYIDIIQEKQSFLMNFIPQKETQETLFSWNYNTQEVVSLPTMTVWEEEMSYKNEKTESKNIISGNLRKDRVLFDMKTVRVISSETNPNKNTETSSDVKIEAQFKNTENQKTWSISLSGTQKMLWTPIDGKIDLSWDNIKNWSFNHSKINFSLSSSQNISASIDMEIKEDVLENPQEYLWIPTNIINMVEFQKKIAVEARKVARMKKIQEAKYLKDLKSGNATLSAYQIDGRNSKAVSDIRTLMSAIEIAASEEVKLSELIIVQTSKKLENIGTVKIGTINFMNLGQNKSDFWDSYADEMQIAILETDDWENQFYQLKGNVIGKDNKPTPMIKWNYFKVDTSYPESLFDTTK